MTSTTRPPGGGDSVLKFSIKSPSRKDVARLHAALTALELPIAADEVRAGAIGGRSVAALRELQRRVGLPDDGAVTADTLLAIERHLEDARVRASKGRIARLHETLARAGVPVDENEQRMRTIGPVTIEAIRDLQRRHSLPADGLISAATLERATADALAVRFTARTQIGRLHRKLAHVARIAKLDERIVPEEVRGKTLGDSTRALVAALQNKYGLPVTGALDPSTVERIDSIAASRGGRPTLLRVRGADGLATVTRALRLNMTGEPVGGLQRTLAFLGHAIDVREFDDRRFGATTRSAVIELQRSAGLPATGHVEGATRDLLNRKIVAANPAAVVATRPRVRGTVRDELWRGRGGLRVQVVDRTIDGPGAVIAERPTGAAGFYDVPYPAGAAGAARHLLVRVLDGSGNEIETRELFNPTTIAWANFTAGDRPYRGASELEARTAAIAPALAGRTLADLEESGARRDLSFVARHARLSVEDVLRVALAHRAARLLGAPEIDAAVFYAFLRQNQPAGLPGDLLPATAGWTAIDALVEQIVDGVVLAEPALQARTFDAAAAAHLIPIATVRARPAILAALALQRRDLALERHLLEGVGRLRTVLAASGLAAAAHPIVADAVLDHRGLGPTLWRELDARAGELGGTVAVAGLRRAAQLGQIAAYHERTLDFLSSAVGDPAHPAMPTVPALAALTPADWLALIVAAGGDVPDGTPGASRSEQQTTYAATLAARAERMFPAVAVTARLAPGGGHGLTELDQIRALVADHADVDFAEINLDRLVAERSIAVPPAVLRQTKVVQRVHRLAPSAALGAALLDARLHDATAVIALGRRRFIDTMATRAIARRDAATMFGRAELQYAKTLALVTGFRPELYSDQPAAIAPCTYTADEQQAALGGVADLETLFGGVDACECEHSRACARVGRARPSASQSCASIAATR